MNTHSLKTWFFNKPLIFALTSFLFIILITWGGTTLLPQTETTIKIISRTTIFIILFCIYLMFRKTNIKKVDRYSFVALTNLQNIIFGILSIVMGIVFYNITTIQTWFLLNLQTGTNITTVTIILAFSLIASLFLLATIAINFAIKLLRIKTMNIPTWKIICSIPFGFTMLWIPGYFLPENNEHNKLISIKSKRYEAFNKWIISTPINAAVAFIFFRTLYIMLSGIASLLLTLSFAMIFALWKKQIGTKQFENNIGKHYATTAVIINIAILIYMLSTIATLQ